MKVLDLPGQIFQVNILVKNPAEEILGGGFARRGEWGEQILGGGVA